MAYSEVKVPRFYVDVIQPQIKLGIVVPDSPHMDWASLGLTGAQGDDDVYHLNPSHMTNKGFSEPLPIGLAPKQITCLSTSDTMTCNAAVGTSLAPETAVKLTALAPVPPLSSQKYTPPARTLNKRSSANES